MEIKIKKLAGAIGAEISGLQVSNICEEQFEIINDALLNHGIIYFREQAISPKEQLDFAKMWNEPHLHPYLNGLPEFPEIIEIVKEPSDPNNFGDHWHTDQIFTPVPAMGTMLYAKEVPQAGGDTVFACMEKAYENLSDAMKKMLGKLSTSNRYDKSAARSDKMQNKIPNPDEPAAVAVHPLIRVHPETGRPSLYLTDPQTTTHFNTMTPEESLPLITFLLDHATRPEFTCRLNWEVGTLAIWDNRRVLHMALNDYPGQRRVMHRITIKGTLPTGLTQSN